MTHLLKTLIALSALVAAPVFARTIAIDVGHSASAQGSTSASGRGEFVYNRALALEIKRILESQGHTVDLINHDGSVRSLQARPARASTIRADLFVSIHHDSIQPQLMPQRERYGGFSVWTSGSHPAARASAVCGRSIAGSMKQARMTPALFHAERIPGEGHTLLDASIGHYRRDGLAVLRLSSVPAVLIEAGVIVNPREEAWLARADVRVAIARAIAAGINDCLRR